VFPSMPASAVRFADPDHVVALDKVAPLVAGIVEEWSEQRKAHAQRNPDGHDQPAAARAVAQRGEPSEFTCPECGGTLWEQQEGNLLRFRCRVGHAYSTESLVAEQREALEGALWGAVVAEAIAHLSAVDEESIDADG
jgi:two-component system chemotaxis response regulator CheB